MGLFDGAFKKFVNFFTPLFGVTNGPPTGYAAGEARPATIDETTGGLRVFMVGTDGDGGDGGGSLQNVDRLVHLPSTALPNGGAFTTQLPYPVPEGVTRVAAYVTYTRAAEGGRVVLRPSYGNGTETAREVEVTSVTVANGVVRDQLNLRDLLGPIVNQVEPYTFLVNFEIPPGCSSFTLLAAEAGTIPSPGTCAIAFTGRYGE